MSQELKMRCYLSPHRDYEGLQGTNGGHDLLPATRVSGLHRSRQLCTVGVWYVFYEAQRCILKVKGTP